MIASCKKLKSLICKSSLNFLRNFICKKKTFKSSKFFLKIIKFFKCGLVIVRYYNSKKRMQSSTLWILQYSFAFEPKRFESFSTGYCYNITLKVSKFKRYQNSLPFLSFSHLNVFVCFCVCVGKINKKDFFF